MLCIAEQQVVCA